MIQRRVAVGAVALAAIVLVFRVGTTFAARFSFPFDLEWMEGGMLAHAWRLQRGLPLYAPPSPDFVPYVYPPGYSAVVAALGDLFGLDYQVGRGVSIAATLASAAAIATLAWRHMRSWLGGLVGAACFLALFRASGGFYDLVRPDSLGLALLAWSIVLAAERDRGTDVAGGLLLCAAFLVKHNFAAFGLPLVAMIGLHRGVSSAVRFTLASAGPALLMTGLLQWRSDGGFLTYLLSVPSSHPMAWNRFWIGMPGEIGLVLLPSLLGIAAWLLALSWDEPGRRTQALGLGLGAAAICGVIAWFLPAIRGVPMTWTSLVGAFVAFGAIGGLTLVRFPQGPSWRFVGAVLTGAFALLIAGLMRAHHGGFMNVVMPAHWAISAGLGLGIGWAFQSSRAFVPWVALAVAGGQLGWLLETVDFEAPRPTPQLVEAGQTLLDELEEACPEGPILAPTVAWAPVRLGRPPSVHLIALWDLDHAGGPYFQDVVDMMRTATKAGHWPCAVQGNSDSSRIRLPVSGYQIARYYRRAKRFSARAQRLRPMTGWRVRSRDILEPRKTP
ncbi:MAG: hypothetical protein AAGA48_21760 [Myxococcota bacterium]